jgi:hypothetical protein
MLNQFSTAEWTNTSSTITVGSSVTASTILHRSGLTNVFVSPQDSKLAFAGVLIFAVDVNTLVAPTVAINLAVVPTTNPEYDLWIFPLPQGFSSRPITTTDLIEDQLDQLRKLMDRNNLLLKEIQSDFEPFDDKKESGNLTKSTIDLASQIKDLLHLKAQ